ncbi:hypothetical protein EJ02DRAFT_462452 [Clathrospora elynae]|uniref:Uncharacterized protein n=1 Tax=Clathrospora elynae TaxID=706981 RepID=A0A6A5T2Z8_9PLEO|nr:hypothetical protein EJ02DRAFT_462452 [Clathrospora elynae]
MEPQPSNQDTKYWYPRTYVPEQSLRLLYIDGLSVAKTSNVTLVTQDMFLLSLTQEDGAMGDDFKRAEGLYILTETLSEGKIDDILRMEGGSKTILCHFKKHLLRIDVVAVLADEQHDRYHGIGGRRVTLDRDNFVSVFAYPNVRGLFFNDVQSDYAMPRLQNVSESDRLCVKDDITKIILRKNWDKEKEPRDWQAAANMVVQRYGKALHFLHTDKKIRNNKDAFAKYLMMLLRPYIDTTARNATLEAHRCVSQLIPSLGQPVASVAYARLTKSRITSATRFSRLSPSLLRRHRIRHSRQCMLLTPLNPPTT